MASSPTAGRGSQQRNAGHRSRSFAANHNQPRVSVMNETMQVCLRPDGSQRCIVPAGQGTPLTEPAEGSTPRWLAPRAARSTLRTLATRSYLARFTGTRDAAGARNQNARCPAARFWAAWEQGRKIPGHTRKCPGLGQPACLRHTSNPAGGLMELLLLGSARRSTEGAQKWSDAWPE